MPDEQKEIIQQAAGGTSYMATAAKQNEDKPDHLKSPLTVNVSNEDSSSEQEQVVKWIGPANGEVLGKIEGPDDSRYLVSKKRVVIGRESTHNQADIVIRENSFVSRGHLIIIHGEDDVWRLSCNGKNGIFVGDKLVKKDAEPVRLPDDKCLLRFPSTMLRLSFASKPTHVLTTAHSGTKSADYISTRKNSWIQGVDKAKDNNNFASPSAAGNHIGAISCPASPRSIVRLTSWNQNLDTLAKATPEPSDSFIDGDLDSAPAKGRPSSQQNVDVGKPMVAENKVESARPGVLVRGSQSMVEKPVVSEEKNEQQPSVGNGVKLVSPVDAALSHHHQKVDGKRVFMFSPVLADQDSRVSQSAPCSPKSFCPTSGLEHYGKDGSCKREHHHSGGTFCVRTNSHDGRQRLQLCHSPPEFVAVTRADTSALQAIAEESRSRRSSGSLLQRYRGGSKSLSTTPVREILASGGPKVYGRSVEAEGIAKALSQASPEPKVIRKRKSSPILDSAGFLPPGVPNSHSALVNSALGAPATGFLPAVCGGNGNLVLVCRPQALGGMATNLTYSATPSHVPHLLQAFQGGTAGFLPPSAVFPSISSINYPGFSPHNNSLLHAAAAANLASLAASEASAPPGKMARSE